VVALDAARNRGHDLLHWFGGWQPRHGVAIGIDFAADPLGAGLALLALIYSFSYLHEQCVTTTR
jgi:hypothetical protein